ncbi:MAG: hypothetical protein ACRC1K_05005, partial [Planctomycetia bacterium]
MTTTHLRRRLFLATSLALVALVALPPATAAEKASPLAANFPAGAAMVLEVDGVAELVERIEQAGFSRWLLEQPRYKEAAKSAEFKRFLAGVALVETQAGMDWRGMVKLLGGGQIGLAVYVAEGKKPEGVLAVATSDAAALEKLFARVSTLLTLVAADRLERETVDDVELLIVQGDEPMALARSGSVLYVANGPEKIKACLERGDDPAGGLAAELKDSLTRWSGGPRAQAVVVTPKVAAAFPKAYEPRKIDNALSALLLGGVAELARTSKEITANLDVAADGLRFTIDVAADPTALGDAYAGFFSAAATPGATPPPQPKGVMASAVLYRDLADLYRRREAFLIDR